MAGKLTPAVWNTQLRLMFNALPFDHRRAGAQMDPPPRPSPTASSPFPCVFCGEGVDAAAHVYGRCPVVREAHVSFMGSLGCHPHRDMNHALLAFPADGNPAASVAIVCFNWAVWTERSQFLPTLGHTVGGGRPCSTPDA